MPLRLVKNVTVITNLQPTFFTSLILCLLQYLHPSSTCWSRHWFIMAVTALYTYATFVHSLHWLQLGPRCPRYISSAENFVSGPACLRGQDVQAGLSQGLSCPYIISESYTHCALHCHATSHHITYLKLLTKGHYIVSKIKFQALRIK